MDIGTLMMKGATGKGGFFFLGSGRSKMRIGWHFG